ncbi:MAG: PEP-CTERM sorting domain-containing protein [Planctomycetota bacterium]|nr:PEP-CTERM sorting domain-containing protein [Planctomycetota bacterium]
MKTTHVVAVLTLLLGAAPAWAGLAVPVWSDGFESGLDNWTLSNPSGDATTLAQATGTYTSSYSQGTITPCEGQYMARLYKYNGGLAYLISKPIPAVVNQLYAIDVCVGGLGEVDNCGFRWNKWGYSADGSTITWVGDNFRNVNPLQCGIDYQFTATADTVNVVLGLDRACRDGLGHSAFFDHVVVTTTPEPATLGLLGVGAVALLRRRKK